MSNDDDDGCPLGCAETACPHLLAHIDLTFRSVNGGALYAAWSCCERELLDALYDVAVEHFNDEECPSVGDDALDEILEQAWSEQADWETPDDVSLDDSRLFDRLVKMIEDNVTIAGDSRGGEDDGPGRGSNVWTIWSEDPDEEVKSFKNAARSEADSIRWVAAPITYWTRWVDHHESGADEDSGSGDGDSAVRKLDETFTLVSKLPASAQREELLKRIERLRGG